MSDEALDRLAVAITNLVTAKRNLATAHDLGWGDSPVSARECEARLAARTAEFKEAFRAAIAKEDL
jgi:hypothetical protein